MLHIAIYDNDAESIERLDKAFKYYCINRNTEFHTSWFSRKSSAEQITKYASRIHLAFVDVNAKNSHAFCVNLIRNNPNCRICYYVSNNVMSVDISNSLWFMEEEQAVFVNDTLAKEIDQVFNGFKHFKDILLFDTRKFLYILPTEDILYLQSDLRDVYVFCKNDEKTILSNKKLANIESSLSDVFLRIHKSYIVNKAYIKRIDKADRMIILMNGEQLPISNSHYQNVLNELGQNE